MGIKVAPGNTLERLLPMRHCLAPKELKVYEPNPLCHHSRWQFSKYEKLSPRLCHWVQHVFYCANLPLVSTGWVRSTFEHFLQMFTPLEVPMSINLKATSGILLEMLMLRMKPRAAGSEAQLQPLCYAAPSGVQHVHPARMSMQDPILLKNI